jgi:hypothetical protein
VYGFLVGVRFLMYYRSMILYRLEKSKIFMSGWMEASMMVVKLM